MLNGDLWCDIMYVCIRDGTMGMASHEISHRIAMEGKVRHRYDIGTTLDLSPSPSLAAVRRCCKGTARGTTQGTTQSTTQAGILPHRPQTHRPPFQRNLSNRKMGEMGGNGGNEGGMGLWDLGEGISPARHLPT